MFDDLGRFKRSDRVVICSPEILAMDLIAISGLVLADSSLLRRGKNHGERRPDRK